MHYFFEDLELPRLVETNLLQVPNWKNPRAGYSVDGSPNNIDVVRSLRSSLGRRIALGGPLQRQLDVAEETLAEMKRNPVEHSADIPLLEEEVKHLRARILRIPFIDPFDLRYVNRVRQPQPSSRAVMFCVMDVSGSMDEQRKDLSKRFFILLYLFLTRHYEKIEVVFIRHHTQAQEVDEQNFFHATETGGTVVSSALVLMEQIIRERYSPSEWNIYGAQASDGDNWHHDSGRCRELLADKILPLCRYFAYVQVAEAEQNLWEEYEKLSEEAPQFAMRKAVAVNQIYPVFRDLFKKEGAPA
jgi:hypothetical protein